MGPMNRRTRHEQMIRPTLAARVTNCILVLLGNILLVVSVPSAANASVFVPFCNIADASLWKMTTSDYRKDTGHFDRHGNAMESEPGSAWGVYWCNRPLPSNFILRLEWLRKELDDNSGVFLRFPNPDLAHEQNTALVAAGRGFEVQIDELGSPEGAPYHRTGAIYGERGQSFSLRPARPLGEWNLYEIQVRGQQYTVRLNGTVVSTFNNRDPNRAKPTSRTEPSYFGVQAERGHVQFRNIEIKLL
jgi:hypothetical protein